MRLLAFSSSGASIEVHFFSGQGIEAVMREIYYPSTELLSNRRIPRLIKVSHLKPHVGNEILFSGYNVY